MTPREIQAEKITKTVKRLCIEANTKLGRDVIDAIEKSHAEEESPIGRDILRQLLENAAIAREEDFPLCQDTGMVVVFAEVGQEVHIAGGDLNEAIHSGVRQAYKEAYLRASTLDPLTRQNFGDNTPAVIHLTLVPGTKLKLMVAPKGFGSENMSRVVLFPPSAGVDGIKKFILQLVEEAGQVVAAFDQAVAA